MLWVAAISSKRWFPFVSSCFETGARPSPEKKKINIVKKKLRSCVWPLAAEAESIDRFLIFGPLPSILPKHGFTGTHGQEESLTAEILQIRSDIKATEALFRSVSSIPTQKLLIVPETQSRLWLTSIGRPWKTPNWESAWWGICLTLVRCLLAAFYVNFIHFKKLFYFRRCTGGSSWWAVG